MMLYNPPQISNVYLSSSRRVVSREKIFWQFTLERPAIASNAAIVANQLPALAVSCQSSEQLPHCLSIGLSEGNPLYS